MASAEDDFPRGGTVKKKSADSKIAVGRAQVDNLFQVYIILASALPEIILEAVSHTPQMQQFSAKMMLESKTSTPRSPSLSQWCSGPPLDSYPLCLYPDHSPSANTSDTMGASLNLSSSWIFLLKTRQTLIC